MMVETLPIQRIKESQAIEDTKIIQAYSKTIYSHKSKILKQLKKQHPSLEDILKLEKRTLNLENTLDEFKETIDKFVKNLFEIQENRKLKKYNIKFIYTSKELYNLIICLDELSKEFGSVLPFIVRQIAIEKKISPMKVVSSREGTDEVFRRIYPSKQDGQRAVETEHDLYFKVLELCYFSFIQIYNNKLTEKDKFKEIIPTKEAFEAYKKAEKNYRIERLKKIYNT